MEWEDRWRREKTVELPWRSGPHQTSSHVVERGALEKGKPEVWQKLTKKRDRKTKEKGVLF